MKNPKQMSNSGTLPDVNRLQKELFSEGVVSRQLLDAVPSPLLIINQQWRVVYANQAALELVSDQNNGQQPGLREGDAFHCVHYLKGPSQEGRKANCHVCGIAKLLSRSLKGEEVHQDCQLTCNLAGAKPTLDLRVWATPLLFHGEHFSILNLIDISDKHRRELLENTCYHDLLNTLTSIIGVLSVMKEEEVEDRHNIVTLLEKMTQDSIDEINTLRLLQKAEEGEITPQWTTFKTEQLLIEIHEAFTHHPSAEDKNLVIDRQTENFDISSDRQLVRRIIGNMVVNALEATEASGTVTIGSVTDKQGVSFWVHNTQVVPEEIRESIFQRDVSQKGHGRGIGTYSMWLLSSLLKGKVHFISDQTQGTTFSLWLPENTL